MALSHLLKSPTQSGALRSWTVASIRWSSDVAVKEELAPNFFQRVSLRFKGVPLKDENQAPAPFWFRHADKVFNPAPLPTVPKDYKEHPERDLVNFPYPEQHMFPPKTRFLIIPDSWLSPLQKVTGTSGPYVFVGGLVAFLLNKEFITMDEHFMKFQILAILYFMASRTFSYGIDSYCYKLFQGKVDALKKVVDDELKDAVEFRKTSAAETESLKAIHEKFPVIFKENLALQLEATYRRNVDAVANELKRRIDYLQEVEATKLRFERDILLKSITQGVYNAINNNEGNIKDNYLDNCIGQLKTLSA